MSAWRSGTAVPTRRAHPVSTFAVPGRLDARQCVRKAAAMGSLACPAPGSIAHAPGTASQALEMVRFGLQRLTVCRPVRI